MTQVFVVIEWEGNSEEVDGGDVRGVYTTRAAAEARVDELTTSRRGRDWFQITEHELDGGPA